MTVLGLSQIFLWSIAAFMCGSIPFKLIATKVSRLRQPVPGPDLGGAEGETAQNSSRGIGVVVFLLEVMSGAIPVLLVQSSKLREGYFYWLLGQSGSDWSGPRDVAYGLNGTELIVLIGLLTLLGNLFSPWTRFVGGIGVGTAMGVAFVSQAHVLIVALPVFILVLIFTRYRNLAIVLGAMGAPVGAYFPYAFSRQFGDPSDPNSFSGIACGEVHQSIPAILGWCIFAWLIVYRNSGVLGRIRNGTEPKVWGRVNAVDEGGGT